MKRIIFTIIAFTVLITLYACKIEKHPDAPYSTHVFLHGQAVHMLTEYYGNQDILEAYDYLIVGEPSLPALEERHWSKVLLRFNPWATSTYSKAQSPWPYHQPGPGDMNPPLPDIDFKGRHCYSWSLPNDHVRQFIRWINAALDAHPEVAGVFLDDFGFDRFGWVDKGDPDQVALAKAIWPNYPDNSWISDQIRWIEIRTFNSVVRKLGKRGIVVLNGNARQLVIGGEYACRRMAESAGGGGEPWSKLLATDGNSRILVEGDFLNVLAIDTKNKVTPIGKENMAKGAEVAEARGLSLGVAYHQKPAHGGSMYQLVRHGWADPSTWPGMEP